MNGFETVAPSTLATWRPMVRIENTGGSPSTAINKLNAIDALTHTVYAEGDSWFDKFTPIGSETTNLLGAVKTPFVTAVVDASHIGDEARDMVRGHQAEQTRAMFFLLEPDAILLSAGGNDLKNVFVDIYAAMVLQRSNVTSLSWSPGDVEKLKVNPASLTRLFEEVVGYIRQFVDMRDQCEKEKTRRAPILLHGYDYFQPRPAAAHIFAGASLGAGPWIYPTLQRAGLNDAQMQTAARAVIDELNRQLAASIGTLPNVHFLDQRGVLTPAAPGSTGDDADWLDEIHPNAGGFAKLARNRWDAPLARALGWIPCAGDLVPA